MHYLIIRARIQSKTRVITNLHNYDMYKKSRFCNFLDIPTFSLNNLRLVIISKDKVEN